MRNPLSLLCLCFAQSLFAASIAVNDNAEVALTLSAQNYNRVLVKEDKIMEAVFPPNTMAIKRDEQDGSVYILLNTPNPFTLFLTTAKGNHFSLTLNAEESLGKTIELIPRHSATLKIAQAPIRKQALIPNEEPILHFLKQLQKHEPLPLVKIQKTGGVAQRWADGFSVIPKEVWLGEKLKGEILELYNGGSKPLTLTQSAFAKEDTLGIAFSKSYLAPHEHGQLYRVSEVAHG